MLVMRAMGRGATRPTSSLYAWFAGSASRSNFIRRFSRLAGDYHDRAALFDRFPLRKKTGDRRRLHAAHGLELAALLAVEQGALLYSQKGGEFEAMRRMQSSSVTSFLAQWKPVKQGCSVMVVTC